MLDWNLFITMLPVVTFNVTPVRSAFLLKMDSRFTVVTTQKGHWKPAALKI